jgi:hypothetical protein
MIGDVFVGFNTLHKSPGASTFHYGGYVSPFDLAIALLAVGMVLIKLLWTENYGEDETNDREANTNFLTVLKNGCVAVATTKKLIVLMIMVACFEGSMYTFVFNWTPALQNKVTTPAFGMIFASFMMAYMCGSCVYGLIQSRTDISNLKVAQAALACGALCFLVAGISHAKGISTPALTLTYAGFIGFEFCVGLYFPSISTLKGEYVPESVRSTVYNIYRVPMNAIVLIVLLSSIKMTQVFVICFALLAFAGISTFFFAKPPSAMEGLPAIAEEDGYGAVKNK